MTLGKREFTAASARVNSRSSGYGSLGCMDTLQVNNHLSRSVSVNTGKLLYGYSRPVRC